MISVRTSAWQTVQRLVLHGLCLTGLGLLGGLIFQARDYLDRQTLELRVESQFCARLLRGAENVRSRHASILKRVQALDEREQSLHQATGRPFDESEFMASVSQWTDRCQLAMKDFQPLHEPGGDLGVRLSLHGSYASLCQFLDGLHSLPGQFQIVDFDLLAPSQSSSLCQLVMTLRSVSTKPAT